MAEIYGPFDSGIGASFRESEWSEMFRHVTSDGVVPAYLNNLLVFADNTGMQVKVQSGAAFSRGHWYRSDTERTLPIAAAHATLARWDLVILKLDWTNNTITIEVKTGTAAASPADPALTQTTSVWETALARVVVTAADGNISGDQVQDQRIFARNQNQAEGVIDNLLTNPGFEIWQRGVGPFVTNGAYNADRWLTSLGGSSTISTIPDSTNMDRGSQYCSAITYVHNAASSIAYQRIENFLQLKLRTLTFAIRVKTTVAGSVRAYIQDSVAGSTFSNYHSGSGQYETLIVTAIVSLATTYLQVGLHASASGTYYADNATLAIGSIPLTYTPLTSAEEMSRCLRYFEVHGGAAAARHPIIESVATAGSQSFSVPVSFAAIKAIVPTLTKNGTFTVSNANQPTASGATPTGYRFSTTSIAAGAIYAATGTDDDSIYAEANP